MTFLDWEKAFDKIDHAALFEALERMGTDDKLIRLIKNMYKEAEFYVEIDNIKSNIYKQKTGIRQGCPLSPYLFILVMTVMFHDIHKK